MYKDFKKQVLAIAAILITGMASAQTAYNVIKWGGTLSVNPTTFTAGSLAGITDGVYNVANTINISGSTSTNRWILYQAPVPVLISSYSITTTSGSRPTAWTFSGSNDGTNYTDLNTQTGQTFTSSTAKNYVITGNTTAYSYYRITFTSTQSTTALAIHEYELFTTSSAPFAPVLTGSALSGTEAGFSWNYLLLATDSFFLERSLDGINFNPVNMLGGDKSSYLDQTLTPSTLFYYRLRAKTDYGYSPYSNIVQVTTNTLSGQSADITDDGGKLYVSADNSGGATAAEGSQSFIDNNVASKWLVFTAQASGNLAAIYKPTGSYIVTSYVLSTANDSPPRDPKSWSFSGSNDSTNWVRLDTQINQLGNSAPRYADFRYILAAPGSVAYKFYRILFTSNNGATDGVRFQIAEWQILGIDASSPAIPTNLAVTNVTTTSISLSWSQGGSNPVTGFRLQRGEDGLNFATIATLPSTTTTYTDQNLYDSTVYYYRIQALGTNTTAISGWSNVASARTNFVAGIPLAPRDLKVVFAIDSVAGIVWTDRSYNEAGFRLQRSVNKVTFNDLKSLPANSTSFNDSTVWPASKYYYRVLAFNTQGNSVFSNIDSAITPGYNHAPELRQPLINKNICSNSAEYVFDINGLVPGPSNESTQSLTVTNVSVDSSSYFSDISFTAAVSNGVATIKLKGSGRAAYGDSVTVSVTIKDNGGLMNFGKDSVVVSFKLFYVPLALSITADREITNVPRYITVHLTAQSNYPSTTPSYSWDEAPGIDGGRGGIVLRVKPIAATTYTVHATSVYGCQASTTITLIPNREKLISNVLTPNGDGKNDTWVIWNITENANNNVKVFDRAGRLVFSRKNYSNDWDGTYNGRILEEGAYTYVVDFGDGQKPSTGILNIIRDHR